MLLPLTYKSLILYLLIVGVICFTIGYISGKGYLPEQHMGEYRNEKKNNLIGESQGKDLNTNKGIIKKDEIGKVTLENKEKDLYNQISLSELEDKVRKEEEEHQKRKNIESAEKLLGEYYRIGKVLGERKEIGKLIEVFEKGRQLEKEAGITGGERKYISFLIGHLIDKWIHTDGEALLQFLRSPKVSMKQKIGIIRFLKEVIEKEYPGK